MRVFHSTLIFAAVTSVAACSNDTPLPPQVPAATTEATAPRAKLEPKWQFIKRENEFTNVTTHYAVRVPPSRFYLSCDSGALEVNINFDERLMDEGFRARLSFKSQGTGYPNLDGYYNGDYRVTFKYDDLPAGLQSSLFAESYVGIKAINADLEFIEHLVYLKNSRSAFCELALMCNPSARLAEECNQ